MIIFNKIESWRHLDYISRGQNVRHWMTDATRNSKISLRKFLSHDVWLVFLFELQVRVYLAGEEVVLG